MAPLAASLPRARQPGRAAAAAAGVATGPRKPAPPSSDPVAIILVGPKQTRFKVNRHDLCAASSFFRDQLQASPSSPHRRPGRVSLWLPGESASMFVLFAQWLRNPAAFRWHLDDAVSNALDKGQSTTQNLHWAMIRLHLFASRLSLHQLQDTAMDSIQDLYLKCDWDANESLITYLYTKCEALPAVRLRRWAVAMVAFSLTGASSPPHPDLDHPKGSSASLVCNSRFDDLFQSLPEFADDYEMHHRKMHLSGLDPRFKNPQLRLPANRLCNDERAFGFRECSFHSHRATIGEKRCPFGMGRDRRSTEMKLDANPANFTLLPAPRKKQNRSDTVPSREGRNEPQEKPLKHIRSISSVLK